MQEETKTTQPQEERQTEKMTGPMQPVVDMGSVTVKNARGTIHTLTIIGQIEGHQLASSSSKTTKYEHVMPLLAMMEQSEDIDGVLFLLNTVGGDVEAGLGIAELIAGMRKPTVSLVLGGGHSIGVPLAVAARVSMIVPTASMTIHPVRMNGTVIAAPQTYRYFQQLQESIVSFVTEHSHIRREKFMELMLQSDQLAADVGCVLYGQEAVQAGLVDRCGSLGDALDCLYEMIRKEKQ